MKDSGRSKASQPCTDDHDLEIVGELRGRRSHDRHAATPIGGSTGQSWRTAESFDPAARVHHTHAIPSRRLQPDAQTVTVVGAGMAGLTAARALSESGHPVHVFEKARSVGGRLATRRIGDATLDHGAQFFTVRTEQFASLVRNAKAEGVVHEWCRGFSAGADGFPRYAVRGGMNHLAKHLARGLDVTLGTQVEQVAPHRGGWRVSHGGSSTDSDALVLTAPMPQNLALLDAGGVALDRDLRDRLDQIAYHPTLALLTSLDRQPAVPEPGGVQLGEGPFSFIADNKAKGASAEHAVTFHVSHEISRDRWDDDPEVVTAELLDFALPWLGSAQTTEVQLKRWRYAQPVEPAVHEIEATTVDGAPLVFAGDAFAGAKVEGAFLSGHAAAMHLRSSLEPSR